MEREIYIHTLMERERERDGKIKRYRIEVFIALDSPTSP